MSRVPPPAQKRTNFRIEAVLEAPTWILIVAVILITLAVIASAASNL